MRWSSDRTRRPSRRSPCRAASPSPASGSRSTPSRRCRACWPTSRTASGRRGPPCSTASAARRPNSAPSPPSPTPIPTGGSRSCAVRRPSPAARWTTRCSTPSWRRSARGSPPAAGMRSTCRCTGRWRPSAAARPTSTSCGWRGRRWDGSRSVPASTCMPTWRRRSRRSPTSPPATRRCRTSTCTRWPRRCWRCSSPPSRGGSGRRACCSAPAASSTATTCAPPRVR